MPDVFDDITIEQQQKELIDIKKLPLIKKLKEELNFEFTDSTKECCRFTIERLDKSFKVLDKKTLSLLNLIITDASAQGFQVGSENERGLQEL
jgi:hypothetical protein